MHSTFSLKKINSKKFLLNPPGRKNISYFLAKAKNNKKQSIRIIRNIPLMQLTTAHKIITRKRFNINNRHFYFHIFLI